MPFCSYKLSTRMLTLSVSFLPNAEKRDLLAYGKTAIFFLPGKGL